MSTKFGAFTSHSHTADRRMAGRIESGVQRFATPWITLRELTSLRDVASLNLSAHRWESIRRSLATSRTRST